MSFFTTVRNLFSNNNAPKAFSRGAYAQPAAQQPQVAPPAALLKHNPPAAGGGNWFNGMGKKTEPAVSVLTIYRRKGGTALNLSGNDVKASGGEGTVYRLPIQGKEHFLVKIYKNATLSDSGKKKVLMARLVDMCNMTNIGKESYLAWPRWVVLNERGECIGFVMNKCEGIAFSSLFSGAKHLNKIFPHWDRSHLVKTALDFINKLEKLANHGVYVNDFNPANFLVNEHCKVSFIDCDSYQIPQRNGGEHVTHTFFPSHVAPELLTDADKLKYPRDIHHVEFGATMLVFQLLMCGLHPYSYCDPSHQSACGNPDENLRKGRCPLGIDAGCKLPDGNWYKLWSWLTGSIKGEFIKTFRNGHSDPQQRTTLSQLKEELKKLEHVMEKAPCRKELYPSKAKPRGDKPSSANRSL